MTPEEAFHLICLHDMKESHRKYGPQHSLVQFNKDREVVSVYRFKDKPDEKQEYESLAAHPKCIQISAWPDRFDTLEDLKQRMEKSMWLFDKMK
jgi:hypothetical protein